MTFRSLISLFLTMLLLAAIPSTSVLMVVSRSLSSGFLHGSMTALGIVVGDVLFILLAILGLSAVATALGGLFTLLKLVSGVYLVVLGVALWRASVTSVRVERLAKASWLSSFLGGLLITIGDQKAVLFYMGLLPAFVELAALTVADIVSVVLIAVVAVGGVKVAYAYAADGTIALFQSSRILRLINRAASSAMILTGLYLLGTVVVSAVLSDVFSGIFSAVS